MQQTARTESDLWDRHILDLKQAIAQRKPDALSRIRLEISRLDNEMSACSLRREIRARAGSETQTLTDRLAFLEGRMNDLKSVAKKVRETMLDHDIGCTPESANKAVEASIEDLNDELKRAAGEIHAGYSIVTRGMRGLAAAYGEMFEPGPGDLGTKGEKLRRQYLDWVKELHRLRHSTWAVEDVVCLGLSRMGSAAKRRCDPQKVYDELVFGLKAYADTFPPTS